MMKKRYVSEVLEADVTSWLDGKKVLISAPTGAGKTTFVLLVLLKYCKFFNKKMVILCNRRLLYEQYGFDLAEQYMRYVEMHEDVEIWTYQQLAERLRSCSNERQLFQEFDVIVCDEVHYFYTDSDFNAFGTYCLLQAVILAGFYKTMVMITATIEEVQPLIVKTFQQAANKLYKEGFCPEFEKYKFRNDFYDFQSWANYDRFTCYYVPDIETLADEIAASDKKSLVFIDDKNKAESFQKLLIKTGKVDSGGIFILNAKVLEENPSESTIRALAVTHKILPKILITTSVLDNGVSIHDADVGNVVIATESKVSFLQMLGRVRAEETDCCRLFIFPRNAEYYEKRIRQYSEKIKFFENLDKKNLDGIEFEVLARGWYGNDEKSELLRNAVVITQESFEYYRHEPVYAALRRGEIMLSINEFAREKNGNLLNSVKEFYRLALEAPQKVAEKQISWIGKKPEELTIVDSSYIKRREEELAQELLKVKNYTNEQLKKSKMELAKKFRKDLLSDLESKDDSFSTDKLEKICERYGLELKKDTAEDKKMRYTIVQKERREEHA